MTSLIHKGVPVGKSFVVSNDQAGIEEILSRIEASAKLVVLEATGRYERLCVPSIAAKEIPVAVVNPRQARDSHLARLSSWISRL